MYSEVLLIIWQLTNMLSFILCTSTSYLRQSNWSTKQSQNYWNVVSWEKQPARRNSFFFSTAVSLCGVGRELGAGRAANTRITNSRMLGCGKLLEVVLHGTSSARLRGSMSDNICAAWRTSYACNDKLIVPELVKQEMWKCVQILSISCILLSPFPYNKLR